MLGPECVPSWVIFPEISSTGSTALPSSPSVRLVDLNPCLFHVHVPNFNGKQTTLGYVLWMLAWAILRVSSVFFLTSFPLPPTSFKPVGRDLFTRLESQSPGPGLWDRSALWCNFVRISPKFKRGNYFSPGLQGEGLCYISNTVN